MIERRENHYWLPPAWRGVASRGYLYASRWYSLIEELGGLRAFPTAGTEPGGAASDPPPLSGFPDMSVLTEITEAEQLDELRDFVSKHLARHERLVLMLVHGERLSFGQVAQVLDLPEPTVRLVYSRTMAALRAYLNPMS